MDTNRLFNESGGGGATYGGGSVEWNG